MTLKEAIFQTKALLNNFDIPDGTIITYLNQAWQEIAKLTKSIKSCAVCDIENQKYLYEITDELYFLDLDIVQIANHTTLDIVPLNSIFLNDIDAKSLIGIPTKCAIERRDEKVLLRIYPTPYFDLNEGLWIYYTKNHIPLKEDDLDKKPELPDQYSDLAPIYACFLHTKDAGYYTIFETKLKNLPFNKRYFIKDSLRYA